MLIVLHNQLHDHGGRRGEHDGGVHQAPPPFKATKHS